MIDWPSIKQAAEDTLSDALMKRLEKNPSIYRGSPHKHKILLGDKTKSWHGDNANGSVFVTPYPAIATDFALSKAKVLDKVEKRLKAHIDSVNFGYDTWDKPLEELDEIPKNIGVKMNLRGFKPVGGRAHGFIHKADYNEVKGRSHMYDRNPDSDVEFLVKGDIVPDRIKKVRFRWKAFPSEEEIARKGEGHVTPFKEASR